MEYKSGLMVEPLPNESQSVEFSNIDGDVKPQDMFQTRETGFCFTSFSSTISTGVEVKELPTKGIKNKTQFCINNKEWKRETRFLSNNNFENDYFKEIVEMGEDAVPLIMSELQKGPTLLVHALDLIYPGKVKYNGYIPLNIVCKIWLNILKQTEMNL